MNKRPVNNPESDGLACAPSASPNKRLRQGLQTYLALLVLFLFLPALPAMAAQTIFGSQTPAGSFTNAARQLGLKFKSDIAGQITAIRFYRVATNGCDTVAHTGYLYNESGTTVLASVAIPASTVTGWQEQALTNPVSITPDTVYVVAVDEFGCYGATTNAGLPVTNGQNLTGLLGVFSDSPSLFPATPSTANYFRDVAFTPEVSVTGACIDLKKSVSGNGPGGPFVRNSETAANPNTTAANPLIAFIPGSNGVPATSVPIPTAYFGGTPVFYQFKITNCGTVDLYNVRLDDCIDKRSIGADGFLLGGVGAGGEGNCEQPRMIPASPQRIVANKLTPGQSITVTSEIFTNDPINPASANSINICNTYGRSRTNSIVRNDAEAEADADMDGNGSGEKFVFFDDLNLVQCKEPPQPTAKLGDRVWEDLDGNGKQDCTDVNGNGILGDTGDTGPECGKGVPGVTVKLGTPDSQGNCVAGPTSTTTNPQGFYQFDNLTPGNYCVQFAKPNICANNTPASFTQPNVGGNVVIDSDANPQTGSTGGVALAAGESNLTVDAGVYCPAKLGDRVWLDNNKDGDQNCSGFDPNNPGQVIPGGAATCAEPTFTQPLPVSLTDCAGNSATNINGDAVAPVNTSNGLYLFENLKPGNYCVQFNRPNSYVCTTPNATGVGYQVNSDGLPNDGVCRTGPVALVSNGDDRSSDLGLYPQAPNCDLSVKKTCEVLAPPTTNWVCSESKPLDVVTMVSNFTSPVKIKAWKGAVGSTLLATIDNIQPNQEVSVSGYAGSPNDVIWEVFNAGTTTKIGQSTFHLSCSDADMNGPEDCGKVQGDGKDKTGFLNNWSLEGLSGNGKTLDCTASAAFPTAESCTAFLKDQPSCLTEGKPTELVFKYTVSPGNSLCTISNTQSGKATCSQTGTFDPNQDASIQAAGNSNLTKDVYTAVPSSVSKDGTVKIAFKGSDFKADSYFRLIQGSNRVDLKIHTSCSQVLAVGDVFGPLTLVGFNGATGGSQVLYGYELTNRGDPLTEFRSWTINLAQSTSVPPYCQATVCRIWPQARKYAARRKVLITETTTNTVTVQTNQACSASDSLTVTVAPPPPPPAVCSELKPIDGIKLEYDASLSTPDKSITGVEWFKTTVSDINNPKASDRVGSTGAIGDGDEFDFTGFAAAGATNDVDFVVSLSDGSKLRSRFHRSCSDSDMNDIADCEKPQGDGKDNASGPNIWRLRDLSGNGKVLGCR